MEYTPEQFAKILKHYEAQQKAWAKYNERRRTEKKEAGTYRPRGRPRKTPTPPPEENEDRGQTSI